MPEKVFHYVVLGIITDVSDTNGQIPNSIAKKKTHYMRLFS